MTMMFSGHFSLLMAKYFLYDTTTTVNYLTFSFIGFFRGCQNEAEADAQVTKAE